MILRLNDDYQLESSFCGNFFSETNSLIYVFEYTQGNDLINYLLFMIHHHQ